ncbi:TPA: Hpt domain-containing protein [Pseudomonas aeruginosa]
MVRPKDKYALMLELPRLDSVKVPPKMRDIFICTLRKDILEARRALQDNNMSAVRHRVHRLGGSLSVVYADSLCNACAIVEEALLLKSCKMSDLTTQVFSLLERIEVLLNTV